MDLVSGGNVVAAGHMVANGAPYWTSNMLDYITFQTVGAGATPAALLPAPAADVVILDMLLYVNTAFSGGAISRVACSAQPNLSVVKYLDEVDVFTGSTGYQGIDSTKKGALLTAGDTCIWGPSNNVALNVNLDISDGIVDNFTAGVLNVMMLVVPITIPTAAGTVP